MIEIIDATMPEWMAVAIITLVAAGVLVARAICMADNERSCANCSHEDKRIEADDCPCRACLSDGTGLPRWEGK